MTYTYPIVTLNINGLESINRKLMLEEFIRRHDIYDTGQATIRPTEHNITYTTTCKPPPYQ